MLLKRVLLTIQSLAQCKKGMAATEFALLLPVMGTLFFGMLEVSDLATANRRVAIAVNTMADLAAQSDVLTHSDVTSLITGASNILEQGGTATFNVNVLSVIVDPGTGNPVVHWSRDELGGAPYTAGDSYTKLDDNTVLNPLGSLIIVEFTYPYVPPFTDHFVSSPVVFTKTSVRWPRLVSEVQLCNNDKSVCTT